MTNLSMATPTVNERGGAAEVTADPQPESVGEDSVEVGRGDRGDPFAGRILVCSHGYGAAGGGYARGSGTRN